MKLVETFFSIQGEGKFAGYPAIFFRFGGCNLNCIGFKCSTKSPKTGEILEGCDTIRAVNLKHFSYDDVNFNALKDRLLSYLERLNFRPILVITGGEPLLNYQNCDFIKFLEFAKKIPLDIHFETNGTINVDFSKYPIYRNFVYAISVKLSNSGEEFAKRVKKDALISLKENIKFGFYKFVLNEDLIVNGANEEIKAILDIAKFDVLVMPQAKNRDELSKNANPIVEFALKNGYIYADRLHIRLYDDKEGV